MPSLGELLVIAVICLLALVPLAGGVFIFLWLRKKQLEEEAEGRDRQP